MSKVLIIMRGLPGSGKSYLTRQIIEEQKPEEHRIFSTDDFWIDERTMKYEFNPRRIGEAHEWNQDRARKAMEEGIPLIIIDNTNTKRWEAKPYVEFGVKFDYEIQVKEPTTSWAKDASECAERNTHNVPFKSIRNMLSRWEKDFTVESILNSSKPQRGGRRGRGGGGYRGRGRGGGGGGGYRGGRGRGGGGGGGYRRGRRDDKY